MFKQAYAFDGVADLLDGAKTTFDATVQEATGAAAGTSMPSVAADAAAAAPPLAPSAVPTTTPDADTPDADTPDADTPAADTADDTPDDTPDDANTPAAELAPTRTLDDIVFATPPVRRVHGLLSADADADGPATWKLPGRGSAPKRRSPHRTIRMTLVEHLAELRTRIIRALLAVVLGVILVLTFYNTVLEFLREPYERLCADRPDLTCDAGLQFISPLEGSAPGSRSAPTAASSWRSR
ncbi:MAG: twin-arginine translocase subunit TatC [Ilumatobacteraceae bacterium]